MLYKIPPNSKNDQIESREKYNNQVLVAFTSDLTIALQDKNNGYTKDKIPTVNSANMSRIIDKATRKVEESTR